MRGRAKKKTAPGNLPKTKQIENRLPQAEFEQLAGAVREALIITEGSGKIAFWNQASERLFGYSAQEALGRSLDGLLAQRANDKGLRRWLKTPPGVSGAAPDTGRTFEFEAEKKDGARIPVELYQ